MNDVLNMTYQEQQLLFMNTLPTLGDVNLGRANIVRELYDEAKEPCGVKQAVCAEDLVYTGTDLNCYIAYNPMKRPDKSGYSQRSSQNAYALTAMYFDLDCPNHRRDDAVIDEALAVIRAAERDGVIPWLTFIVDSGNGLGLYYKLSNSIANTPNTVKMRKLYDIIYRSVGMKLQDVLSSASIEFDPSPVADHARLCRLPGTYNLRAQRYAQIVEYNEVAYELDVFKEFIPFPKSERRVAPVIPITMNRARYRAPLLERLSQLQQSRDDWDGLRQTFCHIYFDVARGCMERSEAIDALYEFNASFRDRQLSNVRLRDIINRRRTYNYSAPHIAEMLGLSPAVAEEFHLNTRSSYEERDYLNHVNTVRRKFAEHQVVVSAIQDCKKYSEVVEKTGVKLRTVKRIAERYGINCKSEAACFADIDWDSVYGEMLDKRNEKKSAKKSTTGFDLLTNDINHTCYQNYNIDYAFSFSKALVDADFCTGYHNMAVAFYDAFSKYVAESSSDKCYNYVINMLCYIGSHYETCAPLEYALHNISDTVYPMMFDKRLRVIKLSGERRAVTQKFIKQYVSLKTSFVQHFDDAVVCELPSKKVDTSTSVISQFSKEDFFKYGDIIRQADLLSLEHGEDAINILADLVDVLPDYIVRDALYNIYKQALLCGEVRFTKIVDAVYSNRFSVPDMLIALMDALNKRSIDGLIAFKAPVRKARTAKQKAAARVRNESMMAWNFVFHNKSRYSCCRQFYDLHMAIKNASRVGSLYVCGIEMSYEVIWKYLYRVTVEDLELMCCEVYTNFESLLFDIVPRVNSKLSSDRPDWLVEGVGFVA